MAVLWEDTVKATLVVHLMDNHCRAHHTCKPLLHGGGKRQIYAQAFEFF